MKKWPHEVPRLTVCEISKAIKDPDWQAFRRGLKGQPTSTKLHLLHKYLTISPREELPAREIRVANYINALKRGGQLNADLEVQR